MKIYLANDLFSEANRDYNLKVSRMISEKFGEAVTQYVPQLNEGINDKNAYADAQMIADADIDELMTSDILVAILDSNDVGVALEIGVAYQSGMPIVGLYTDVRQFGAGNQQKIEALKKIGQNQFSYVNLMETGMIMNAGYLVNNTDDMLTAIDRIIDKLNLEVFKSLGGH